MTNQHSKLIRKIAGLDQRVSGSFQMGLRALAFACAAVIVFAFNERFVAAYLKMDNATVMSLWASDGASLLPQTPIIGKVAVGKFMKEVTAKMPGFHMEKMDIDFQGIEVRGNWASDWAFEHQLVRPPDDRSALDGSRENAADAAPESGRKLANPTGDVEPEHE